MAVKTYIVGDEGEAWRLDNHTLPWIDISVPASYEYSGFKMLDVMSDKIDPSKVCIVGRFRNQQFGLGDIQGLGMSFDAGATWFTPGGNWADKFLNIGNVGGDGYIREVWWVDANTIYCCGDAYQHPSTTHGNWVWKSIDGGLTFNSCTDVPDTWVSGQRYRGAIHAPSPDVVITAGSQTDSVSINSVMVHKSTDGGVTWQVLNGGNTLVDTLPNGTVTGPCRGIFMSDDETQIVLETAYCPFLSIDSGATIVAQPPQHPRSYKHLTWYAPWASLPDTFLVTGGGNTPCVVQSLDSGATFQDHYTNGIIGGMQLYSETNGYYSLSTSGPSCTEIMHTTNRGDAGDTLSFVTTWHMEAVWTGGEPEEEPCGCPDGFTYNPITEECEQTLITSANCGAVVYTVQHGDQITAYGDYGGRFYESTAGRPLPFEEVAGELVDNGGLGSTLNNVGIVVNSLWGTGNPANGRLNACGVWTGEPTGLPHNEWIGFTTCIEVPAAATYCIGIAGDNAVRFKIDTQEWLEMDTSAAFTFKYWHVIPIELSAGTHIIQLEGKNYQSFAAFGAEIYEADIATLIAMTTTVQLAAVTLFSTENMIGLTFDLGESSGCQCPEGYILSNCSGTLECIQMNTTPFEPCCCYKITDCENPENTNIIKLDEADPNCPLDTGLVYKFSFDADTCWTVEESTECDDEQPIVTVTETFNNCEDCKCYIYELSDCVTGENLYTTDIEMQYYVGHVIKWTAKGYEETCSKVTIVECPEPGPTIYDVFVIDCYDNCEQCLFVPPPPENDFRQRTVKPGYNTCCTPDYVQRISCNFSEALYQHMAKTRFGVEFCCDTDVDKWSIKKQLLDLDCLKDPTLCNTLCERNFIAELCCIDSIPAWELPDGSVIHELPETHLVDCDDVKASIREFKDYILACLQNDQPDPSECFNKMNYQETACGTQKALTLYVGDGQWIYLISDGENNFKVYVISGPPEGPYEVQYADCCSPLWMQYFRGIDFFEALNPASIQWGFPEYAWDVYYDFTEHLCKVTVTESYEVVTLDPATPFGTIIKDTKGDCYEIIEFTDESATIVWDNTTYENCVECLFIPPPVGCTCNVTRVVNPQEEALTTISYWDCAGDEHGEVPVGPYQYMEICVDWSKPNDFPSPLLAQVQKTECCEEWEPQCCFELIIMNDGSVDIAELWYLPCDGDRPVLVSVPLGAQEVICANLCDFQLMPSPGIFINWHYLNLEC